MSDFRIDITDLPGFRADLLTAPNVFGDELMTAAQRISQHGESLSKGYAPVASGAAKGSVYSKTQRGAVGITSIFGASAEHAWWADKGRAPGKMPPKGALLGWHGVTADNEFIVRRAIGRRGTKGKPFVTHAFAEIKAGFAQREFGQAIARALRRIGGH